MLIIMAIIMTVSIFAACNTVYASSLTDGTAKVKINFPNRDKDKKEDDDDKKEDDGEKDLHDKDGLLKEQKAAEYNGENDTKGSVWDKAIEKIRDFAKVIKIITNAYFLIGVLTCFLVMIINIVRYAAAPGNIFARQQFYYNLGATVVCTALLGAVKILVDLIIATCIGSP